MKVVAAILAAGRGTRFGADKVQALLGRKPVWRWAVDAYLSHPEVDGVLVVGATDTLPLFDAPGLYKVVPGGTTRQDSSWAALQAAPPSCETLLVHDAARPFVTPKIISDVLAGIRETGAAAAAVRVTDTIKQMVEGGIATLDRSRLWAMQTPQGARVDLLRRAHEVATDSHTDDMALIEALGVHPRIVEGDPRNFKITHPEDLARARAMIGGAEMRTGLGYDIHPFSDDPSRTLYLGGVAFPDHPALDGHSDADVILHAATDALLGAAGLGDIGQHFPNTDPRWRGEPSLTFLRHAGTLLKEAGWRVVNLDMTAIAESPKIMKRADDIRAAVANALEIEVGRVSIKATTNERLGAIGRKEGIAAFATATIAERF